MPEPGGDKPDPSESLVFHYLQRCLSSVISPDSSPEILCHTAESCGSLPSYEALSLMSEADLAEAISIRPIKAYFTELINENNLEMLGGKMSSLNPAPAVRHSLPHKLASVLFCCHSCVAQHSTQPDVNVRTQNSSAGAAKRGIIRHRAMGTVLEY